MALFLLVLDAYRTYKWYQVLLSKFEWYITLFIETTAFEIEYCVQMKWKKVRFRSFKYKRVKNVFEIKQRIGFDTAGNDMQQTHKSNLSNYR